MKQVEEIIKALRALAKSVEASSTTDQRLNDIAGQFAPPLTREDLAWMATALVQRLQTVDATQLSDDWSEAPTIQNIDFVKANVIQHFWNGNAVSAYGAYRGLLDSINDEFSNIFTARVDWEKLSDRDLMPAAIKRRLRAVKTHTEAIEEDAKDLQGKVDTINAAHDTALELPTDLESLREARVAIASTAQTVTANSVRIIDALGEARQNVEAIDKLNTEAQHLVEETSAAYRAATTMGLSESFQTRADITAKSMWFWVVGLIVALGLSAYVGATRVAIVEQMIRDGASPGLTRLHTLLAFLAVAAPVWFAWLATKQIGQRFRVSEDYAFKASVARAYEGFRREAVSLDETFTHRLFKSALDRLDEAPLRFVEQETHGSPMHEWWKLRLAARRGAEQGAREATRAPTPAAPAGTAEGEER